MDPGLLFVSQINPDAFFGRVTESKREKLEMRVGENTLMDKSAANVRKQHIQDRIDIEILSKGTEK